MRMMVPMKSTTVMVMYVIVTPAAYKMKETRGVSPRLKPEV